MAKDLFASEEQQGPRDLFSGEPEGQQGVMPGFNRTMREAIPAVSEAMAAVNRGAVNVLDFLTTDQINAILELSGSEKRIPSFEEMTAPATAGGLMEEGLARDIVRGAGEALAPGAVMGQAVRGASTLPGVIGSVSKAMASTPTADLGFSALSGAGAEFGRELGGEEGALIGSILAPATVAAGQGVIKKGFDLGKGGIESISKAFDDSVEGMSEEGAARMMAESLERSGMTADDAIKQLADLGPEAIPADISNNFARRLKEAANVSPRIEAQQRTILNERQAGSADRILSAMDDATGTSGLTVDDEIVRLENIFEPKINELYGKAAQEAAGISGGENSVLRKSLSGNINSAVNKAVKDELKLKELAGSPVSEFTKIDATKRAIDDEIGKAVRKGAMNKASNYLDVKKQLLSEADELIPSYANARNMFAGKKELENAASLGENFFKTNARQMKEISDTMGASEKKVYTLAAKRALVDKLSDEKTTTDIVNKLFSRNGDVDKLKSFFGSDEAFKTFKDTLEKEAQFALTRRAIQGGPTTARQSYDILSGMESLNNAREAVSTPSAAINVLGRIMAGLAKDKQSRAHKRALEIVGDILLERNVDPEKIRDIIKRGNADEIAKALNNAVGDNLSETSITPILTGAVSEATQTE